MFLNIDFPNKYAIKNFLGRLNIFRHPTFKKYFYDIPTSMVGFFADSDTLYGAYLIFKGDEWHLADNFQAKIIRCNDEGFTAEAQTAAALLAKKGLADVFTSFCVTDDVIFSGLERMPDMNPDDRQMAAMWHMAATFPQNNEDKIIVVCPQGNGLYWLSAAPKTLINEIKTAWRENEINLWNVCAIPEEDALATIGTDVFQAAGTKILGCIPTNHKTQKAVYAAAAALPQDTINRSFFSRSSSLPMKWGRLSVVMIVLCLLVLMPISAYDIYLLKSEEKKLADVRRTELSLSAEKKLMKKIIAAQRETKILNININRLKSGVSMFVVFAHLGTIKAEGAYFLSVVADETSLKIIGEAVSYEAALALIKKYETDSLFAGKIKVGGIKSADNGHVLFDFTVGE